MNKLKSHRKAFHIDQWELAESVGVSQATICRLEKYHDLPSPKHAQALAAHFGVKVNVLFPDGVMPRRTFKREPDPPYMPDAPEPLRRVVGYLERCPKCGEYAAMRDRCYACGMGLEVEAGA